MSSVPPPLPPLAQPVDPAWAQALRSRLRVPSEKWAKFLCVSIGPLAFLAVFYVLGAFPDFGKAVGPMVGTSLGAAIMASYWFNVRAARVRGLASPAAPPADDASSDPVPSLDHEPVCVAPETWSLRLPSKFSQAKRPLLVVWVWSQARYVIVAVPA